jgi:hypothetical protein
MASLANSAVASAGEFSSERDLVWLKHTGDLTAGADLTDAVEAVGAWYSVSVIGTPAAGGTMFGVHGPTTLPTDLGTRLNAIAAGTASIVTIDGVTFA